MKLQQTNLPAYLQLLYEQSSDFIGFCVVDKKKVTTIYLNPASYKILGIPLAEDVSQMKLSDIYTSWSVAIIKEKGIPTAIAKGVWRGKVAICNRKGKEIPISQVITMHTDKTGKIQFFSSVAREIGEFRQREQQTKLYETTLSQYISDAIIITDADFIIREWNKAAEDLYGWKREEVINKSATDILFAHNIKRIKKYALLQLQQAGSWKEEVRQKRKNGEELFISAAISVIKNNAGIITGYIAVNRDITESKALEQRKDDFINMASHELKTPLTSFRIYAHIIGKKLRQLGDPHITDFTQKMNIQVEKLSQLIEELLDVTRLEKGKMKIEKRQFLLYDLVKEVEQELHSTMQHKLICQLPKTVSLYADKLRIRQVLVNLLTNAMKYSPQGSTIVIAVKTHSSETTVSVTDNGIGIAKDEQEKIFDRFYQVKGHETYPGLGLGLYISSLIVAAHKGKMRVESAPGKGSTFFFTVPVKK